MYLHYRTDTSSRIGIAPKVTFTYVEYHNTLIVLLEPLLIQVAFRKSVHHPLWHMVTLLRIELS